MTALDAPTHEPIFQRLRTAKPFRGVEGWELGNGFQRPVALGEWTLDALVAPVTRRELSTSRSLIANRLLWNGYETGNLYLPTTFGKSDRVEFDHFYEPSFVAANAALRPVLEDTCLSFLETEIRVAGPWTPAALIELTTDYLTRYEASTSDVVRAIEASPSPQDAARLWLIQVAPDFLSEASQMARALPGSYGAIHSELTKIFIDEFGYGVHHRKHSTLFEASLESIGLRSHVHAYYHFYLPSSLAMTSYFYAVTIDKRRFFEYLGALWWIEAVVPHFNRQFRKVLKRLFGEGADTEYFDEHIGIDIHHRRMALDKLIAPSVEKYGNEVLHDVIRGIESARLLGELADEDLLAQVAFLDSLGGASASANANAGAGTRVADSSFGEARALSGTDAFLVSPTIADALTRVRVESGVVEVAGGYTVPHRFEAGASFDVPAGRLFGVRADGAATVRISVLPREASA